MSQGKPGSNSPSLEKSKPAANFVIAPAAALLRNRNAVTEVASVDGESMHEEAQHADQ